MKNTKSFFAIAMAFLFILSCSKDNEDHQIQSGQKTIERLSIQSWDEVEISFFDFNNSTNLVSKTRKGHEQDALNLLYNQLVVDNEAHDFVPDFVQKLGIPLWADAFEGKSTAISVIFLPTAFKGEMTGFVKAFIDLETEEVRINLIPKALIDIGEGSDQSQQCMEFLISEGLRREIGGESFPDLDEVFCESCRDYFNTIDELLSEGEPSTSRCDKVEMEVCITIPCDDGGGSIGNGGTSNPFPFTTTNIIHIGGHGVIGGIGTNGTGTGTSNSGGGNDELEPPHDWDGRIPTLTIPSIPPILESAACKQEQQVGLRNCTPEVLCNTFEVIACFENGYWNVLEILDCLDCDDDGDITNDIDEDDATLFFISKFASKYGLELSQEEIDAIKSGVSTYENPVFEGEAMDILIDNSGLIITSEEKDYVASNFEIYVQIDEFLDKHINESESKQNLSKAIASGYVKLLEDENLTDLSIDLGDVGNIDDPYWEIAKDLLLESVKELLIDIIPGGTLATIGPEVIANVQSGNWMDVLYGVGDIILNEADAFFPAAKMASFSVGAFVTGKQLKKVFSAFKKAKALGEVFLKKLYNLLRINLGWSIKDVREKFKWVDNTVGVHLDDIASSDFFQELKDAFLAVNTGLLDDNANPIFKLLEIEQANLGIYTILYPDSDSGFNWTIAFYTGPVSLNNSNKNNLNQKFKIRFDN